MTKERLYYLDMARGLAILLVVAGHIFPDSYFKIFITSFHVPLFFIISGCLIKYLDKYSLNIREKIYSFIVPYVSFSIFCFPFFLLNSGPNTGNIKAFLFYFFFGKGIWALWYLMAIFISELTFMLLLNIIKNSKLLFLIIILLSSIGFMNFSSSNIFLDSIILVISRSLIGLLFLFIGYICFNYINKVNISSLKLLFFSLPFVLLSIYNKQVDLYSLKYNNHIFYLINSISLSFISILLFKNIKLNKLSNFLKFCGINSLTIMATHQSLIVLIQKLTHNNFNSYLSSIILFLIVISLDIMLVYVINTYLPFIIGKKHTSQRLSLIKLN